MVNLLVDKGRMVLLNNPTPKGEKMNALIKKFISEQLQNLFTALSHGEKREIYQYVMAQGVTTKEEIKEVFGGVSEATHANRFNQLKDANLITIDGEEVTINPEGAKVLTAYLNGEDIASLLMGGDSEETAPEPAPTQDTSEEEWGEF